jgi:hypothetical protein
MPTADIDGPQRKVVWIKAHPVRSAWGDEGIPVRDGKTLPFALTRGWNAPAGHYPEAWYLVDPSSREVLYEAPVVDRLIWGLPAVTEVTDRIEEPLELAPGSYLVVLALAGMSGGEFEVEAFEVSEAAA